MNAISWAKVPQLYNLEGIMIKFNRLIKSIVVVSMSIFSFIGIANAENRQITLQLPWFANSGFSGEIIAMQNGYFSEKGLDVTILPGGPGSNTVQELVSGTADIALGYGPQVMYSVNRGLPIVSFGAALQKAPLTWFSRKGAGIESVKDWAGKRIGAGQGAIPFIKGVLSHHGMTFEDVTWVQAGVPGLLQDQVDAVAAWPINFAQMAPIRALPDCCNSQAIFDNGLPLQSNFYMVRKETLEDDQEMLVAFFEAVQKGWAFASDNPEKTIEILIDYLPALKSDEQLNSLTATTDGYMYSEDTAKHGWGHISSDRWQEVIDVYVSIGELKQGLTAEDMFSDVVLNAANRIKR